MADEYPWKNVLCYDYETTGVDRKKDRPLQIGVCDGTGRVCINTLCDPCMPIDPGASEVHGIAQESVKGFPDYLIALYGQMAFFRAYDDPIIAGFNTSMFDGPMLEACLGPVLAPYRQLDLLDVIYRYFPELEKKKLTELHETFLGRPLVGAHGAIQDCIGTAEVLREVCRRVERTPDQLVEELKTPKAYEIMPIGKYRGRRLEDIPLSWASWMSSNAEDMRPDLQLTVNAVLNR